MEKRATLVFEDYPEQEYSVRLSPVSMRQYLDFIERWDEPTQLDAFREQIATFEALAIPTWTSGEEAFTDLDFSLIRTIVTEWATRVKGVPAPLLAASSATAPSQAPQRSRRNSSERRR